MSTVPQDQAPKETTFALGRLSYVFDVADAPGLTSRSYNGRQYTIRPYKVELISRSDRGVIQYACIEGPTLRKSDGELGNRRLVLVGPGNDPVPDYVDSMLTLLGLTWAGGAR